MTLPPPQVFQAFRQQCRTRDAVGVKVAEDADGLAVHQRPLQARDGAPHIWKEERVFQ